MGLRTRCRRTLPTIIRPASSGKRLPNTVYFYVVLEIKAVVVSLGFEAGTKSNGSSVSKGTLETRKNRKAAYASIVSIPPGSDLNELFWP